MTWRFKNPNSWQMLRLLMITVATAGATWVAPVYGSSPEVRYGDGGMVASRSRLASVVGAQVLDRGGNAIDAAVATGFALAVTYPSAGNLGGGGFMLIRLADGTTAANDHRERAPGAATRDMYLDEQGQVVPGRSTKTHLAVGVPGTVAGLLDVLERYGTMDRKTILQPAVNLARRGFVLDHDLARQFNSRQKDFALHPGTVEVFGSGAGEFAPGDVFRQRDLGRTLERIRRKGRDGFYAGPTADLLVAEMQRGGGLISHDDLLGYESQWRQPLQGTYRGHTVISMPPPSSGGVLLLQMLNMLEPHDLGSMGYGSADAMHLVIEAERRAYADRAEHLGDPDFYPVPIAQLIDKAYAQARFADLDLSKASRSADIGPGQWPEESPDTTHVSVMDAQGNAVAYTTTLNLSYGSKIVAEGTGVLLNNEMDDFSAKANVPNFYGLIGRKANAIEPGKRMLSSMTPTIVAKDGVALLATGSPGGSTIITTTLQVILNVIDFQMPLSDAVAKPRFHHQWQPDRVIIERYGVSPDTLTALKQRGHENFVVMPFGRGIGDANSVMQVDGQLQGMADPRNAGAAVGVPGRDVKSD